MKLLLPSALLISLAIPAALAFRVRAEARGAGVGTPLALPWISRSAEVAPAQERVDELRASTTRTSIEPPPDRGQAALVAGLVVDDADAPVAGAWVRACRLFGEPAWSATQFDARTDSEGRFEILGSLQGDFQVGAWAGSHRSGGGSTARCGDRNVRLVLRRTGALAMQIHVGEGIPAGDLELRFTPEFKGGDAGVVYLSSGGMKAFGFGLTCDDCFDYARSSLLLPDLLLGSYTLEVFRSEGRVPLAEIRGIGIRCAGVNRDARLDFLDLSSRVYAHQITMVDATGEHLHDVDLRVSDLALQEGWREVGLKDGVGTVLSSSRAVEIRASAAGYVTRQLHGVVGSKVIDLARAP